MVYGEFLQGNWVKGCVVLIFGDIAKMCSKKCVPIYSLPTVYENTCLPTPPLTLQVVRLLHTYSKILFIVYLKFNFNWASCNLLHWSTIC